VWLRRGVSVLVVAFLLLFSPPRLLARGVQVPRLHLPHPLRLIIFAPHPDDETLGAGGLIKRVVDSGGKVQVVFVSGGDSFREAVKKNFHLTNPAEEDFIAFGQLRQREALKALWTLGVQPGRVIFLGFPESGLDHLWKEHWSPKDPYTSPYTGKDYPPYPNRLDPQAHYDGVDLVTEIKKILKSFSPTMVVIPHPYDGQSDHVATASFVLEALEGVEREEKALPQPHILTYLIHHSLWPHNSHLGMDGGLLPPSGSIVPDTAWYRLPLTSEEVEAKSHAIHKHQTQMAVMGHFLVHFVRTNEVFGVIKRRVIAKITAQH
jgi:LmbE family N-acetylglucosaminyl deacetylase